MTPTDHAVALYEAAAEPKRLIMQRHTTHYAAYAQHGDAVIPHIVAWFQKHQRGRAVQAVDPEGTEILKEHA